MHRSTEAGAIFGEELKVNLQHYHPLEPPHSGRCLGTVDDAGKAAEDIGHRHPTSENKQINVTRCPSAISTDAVVNKSEVSRNSLNNFYFFFKVLKT